jgi:cell division protease FtsH
MARRMVCDWGMSETLGPLTFGKQEEHPFLGRELGSSRDHSEQTAEIIDQEVRRLVDDAHKRALELLRENMEKLTALAEALLVEETLDSEAVEAIVEGRPRTPKPKPAAPAEQAAPKEPPAPPSDEGPKEEVTASDLYGSAREEEGGASQEQEKEPSQDKEPEKENEPDSGPKDPPEGGNA